MGGGGWLLSLRRAWQTSACPPQVIEIFHWGPLKMGVLGRCGQLGALRCLMWPTWGQSSWRAPLPAHRGPQEIPEAPGA